MIYLEKVVPLLDWKGKPDLTGQATGTKTQVPNMPTVGSLRQRVAEADVEKTYFILFGNFRVRQGSLVTLILGELKQENLVVE